MFIFKLKFPLARLLICFFMLITSVLLSQETNSKQEIERMILEGDQLALREMNHQKALDKYLSAYKIDQNNYEILWRLSRTYINLGRNHPYGNDDEQKKKFRMYARGHLYAQKSIELNPDNTLGFTYRAIANKYIALIKGIWGETDLIKLIKFDCERAVKLDPQNHLAYYIFGSMHAKLSEEPKIFRWPFGLDWANIDDAILYFERAISLRADNILYRLDCAIVYIEEENFSKAKEHLNIIKSLPNQDEYDVTYKRKAKEIYEMIKYK